MLPQRVSRWPGRMLLTTCSPRPSATRRSECSAGYRVHVCNGTELGWILTGRSRTASRTARIVSQSDVPEWSFTNTAQSFPQAACGARTDAARSRLARFRELGWARCCAPEVVAALDFREVTVGGAVGGHHGAQHNEGPAEFGSPHGRFEREVPTACLVYAHAVCICVCRPMPVIHVHIIHMCVLCVKETERSVRGSFRPQGKAQQQ